MKVRTGGCEWKVSRENYLSFFLPLIFIIFFFIFLSHSQEGSLREVPFKNELNFIPPPTGIFFCFSWRIEIHSNLNITFSTRKHHKILFCLPISPWNTLEFFFYHLFFKRRNFFRFTKRKFSYLQFSNNFPPS